MAKKKIGRKQLKQPDEFITLTAKAIQWGQKHTKEIGFTAIALVGILLATVGYRYVDNKKETRGFALLNQARVKYAAEMEKTDDPEKVYEAVRDDYQKIIDDFSGNSAGRIARKRLGDICFEARQYDRAIELYEKSLVDFKKEPFYRSIILNDLAYACDANKNDEAAMRYFKMIIEIPGAPLKDQAMFHLAGYYEKQEKMDRARELYKKINDQYAESLYIDLIKEKISG